MMRKSNQSNAAQLRHPQPGMDLTAARRAWEQQHPFALTEGEERGCAQGSTVT